MTAEAFYHRDGDAFFPLEPSRGFWSADSIHGRAVAGLIGHEIERRHGGEGLMPARLSVDLHRLARFQPAEITTRVIRDGGRLRLIEATYRSAGVEYARALCQFLRPTDPPPGRVWPGAAPWTVPPPAALTPISDPERKRLAEWRLIEGDFGAYGPRRVWTREYFPVVVGEPLTPFGRVAVAADFASPWIHSSDQGIFYINSDVVIQLHRLPEGEWIGAEATVHDASQGIAVGNCRIYDEAGSIGFIGITALANARS